MSKKIQAIRGMHDILPESTPLWRTIEDCMRAVLERYGYAEIRLPLVEMTELFRRSIGEVTDIVEKEMYTFEDRNGDSLTLRPEGTAGCVRAGLEHGLLHNQLQRLWYAGPMFRHERPQKGRYRQFHQFGVEAFGMTGPDIDVELILISRRIWRELGLRNLALEINTLGTADERATYREHLVDFLGLHESRLDEDSRRRLHTNPLRILDSKNPAMRELIEAAPVFTDFVGVETRRHFDGLCAGLDALGVRYTVNPRLVRGLDYYCHTVFEWVTDQLGAQGTVCAGGRYDGLVPQLGGKPVPAIGFAVGLERLVSLLEEQRGAASAEGSDVFVVAVGEEARQRGLLAAELLRDRFPGLKVSFNCDGGGFKSQFKAADRSGARFALVLAEAELSRGVAGLKPLREEGEQREVPLAAIVDGIAQATGLEPAAADAEEAAGPTL